VKTVKTTLKIYPWSGYDLSSPDHVLATCPNCDWKQIVVSTKDTAYFGHVDQAHSELVVTEVSK
jgi:hypothetical protein